MNRTITADRYNNKYNDYPYDLNRPMTRHQRRTLEELIYSRISNLEEQNRRLAELEDFNFSDAQEMIDCLVFAKL